MSARSVQHRFRPTRWPTLGAIALIVATLLLGNWQRHRAAEKTALQAQYDAMRAAGPAPITAFLGELRERPAALRYRALTLRGEYEGAQQIYLDNRVHEGRAGYEVVTPFRIEGVVERVLVDRGWIAQGASRAQLPFVPTAKGVREIVGRVNLPPQHYVELARQEAPTVLWQNLDIARLSAHSGLPLLPIVIELDERERDGLVRAWPEPNFGREQHVSYMVQWYSLAALTLVLYVALNWRKTE